MKTAANIIVVSFFLFVVLLVSTSVLTRPIRSPEMRAAEEAARIRNLRFFTTFWQIACVAAVTAGCRPGDLEVIRSTRLVRFELYDLESDPGEREDVAAENAAVTERLRTELVELLADVQSDARQEWNESWLRRW